MKFAKYLTAFSVFSVVAGVTIPAQAITLTSSVNPSPVIDVDGASGSVDLNLSGPGNITDIDLDLDLTGSGSGIDSDGDPTGPAGDAFFNELSIRLTRPSDTGVDLIPANTYSNANGLRFNLTLDDSATNEVGITNGGKPESGTFAPVNSFSDFLGETASGTYTVEITDNSEDDPKSLNSATLTVQTDAATVPFEAEGTMGLVALGGFLGYRYLKKRKQVLSQESN